MRIGMVAQSMSRNSGGVGEAMRMHAEAIQAVDSSRVVSIFAAADLYSSDDRALYGDMSVEVSSTIGPKRFRYAPCLADRLVAANLDVLHVHGVWSPIGISVLQWHRRTGRPFIVAPHGMLEDYILHRSWIAKRIVSIFFQDRLMRKASAIHSLTDTEREQARRHYPTQTRFPVIANYVYPRVINGQERPSWWKQQYTGKKIMLFFGRLHSKKGVQEILEAWSRLSEESSFRTRTMLVLCGWIDDLSDFEASVAKLATRHGNILFAGPQFGDQKWLSYAAASIMILPSKSEGLPMAVLEAWSMGIPTVMSRECNLPEGFANGAALLCGTSVNAIVDGLRVAVDLTQSESEQRGLMARRLVKERFTQEAIGKKLCDMFDMVTS